MEFSNIMSIATVEAPLCLGHLVRAARALITCLSFGECPRGTEGSYAMPRAKPIPESCLSGKSGNIRRPNMVPSNCLSTLPAAARPLTASVLAELSYLTVLGSLGLRMLLVPPTKSTGAMERSNDGLRPVERYWGTAICR